MKIIRYIFAVIARVNLNSCIIAHRYYIECLCIRARDSITYTTDVVNALRPRFLNADFDAVCYELSLVAL